MPSLLDTLYAHMWWAHDALLSEFRREPPDTAALRLVAHIVATEHLWLARIDRAEARAAIWPSLSLDAISVLEKENRARFAELLAGRAGILEKRVQYRNSAGNAFDNSVEEILQHVALHGHYHRGQVARMMRDAGREPVYTDYIGFVRKGR